MNFREFSRSMMFLKTVIKKLTNKSPSEMSVSAHYIGGEILLLNSEELHKMVKFNRSVFAEYAHFVDGVQSNLIAGKGKLDSLVEIFDNRIGTSEEFVPRSRTIKGDPELYHSIYENSIGYLSKKGIKLGIIYAVSEDSNNDAFLTYKKSTLEHRDFGLRPVFSGGAEHEQTSNIEHLKHIYLKVLDSWFMSGNNVVEPFTGFIESILSMRTHCSGCPFQNNCTKKSISLEANGDIYVCMDMADSKQFKLGNAIEETMDYKLVDFLASREESINHACGSCEYKESCQGGCMSEAIHAYGTHSDKTPYCELWKAVHRRINELIELHSPEKTREWIKRITK